MLESNTFATPRSPIDGSREVLEESAHQSSLDKNHVKDVSSRTHLHFSYHDATPSCYANNEDLGGSMKGVNQKKEREGMEVAMGEIPARQYAKWYILLNYVTLSFVLF